MAFVTLRRMRKTITLAILALPAFAFAQSGQVGGNIPPVMITEIMYNSPESGNDTLEFVELYNTSGSAVSMAGVTFTSGITYAFPPDVSIPGNGYLVIAGDSVRFAAFYGGTARQWAGGTTQLSNSGEALVMKTSLGEEVDSVFYDDAVAWPQLANGQGTSLVVCSTSADNSLATSWYASTTVTGDFVNAIPVFASPNAADACLSVGMRESKSVKFDVHPNPTSDKITLSVASDIELYDMTGQKKGAYWNVKEVNLTAFAPGLYILRTAKGEMVRIVKK